MQKQLYFYVLPQETTYLHPFNSSQIISFSDIVQDFSSDATFNALKYRYPLKYLGKNYEQVQVVCIPAREHHVNLKENKNQTKVPTIIKIDRQEKNNGYRSGRRSAILFIQGKMIRYKGCGNDFEGFVQENNQLRGSHFFHTSKRQIFMTEAINKILIKQINCQSANKSLFFYDFTQETQKIEGANLKNQLPLLSKYCCVFQTQGDRRVGTHLISPLEIFFLNIFVSQQQKLTNFFKKFQRVDEMGEQIELLVDFELFLSEGENFLNKYQQSKVFQNYVTIINYLKFNENKNMVQTDNFKEFVQKIATKFIKDSSEQVANLLDPKVDWINIINIIIQKVGFQMGEIKRIFCQNEINWGFFNDHNMWHCNAHLNNFIVTIPSQKRFTIPLDFDLAYTKQQHINIDLTSPNYGKKDDDNFEGFLLAQYNAMEMSVSGVQVMNFKYSIDEEEKKPSRAIKLARIVFRDTLLKSFREAMRNNKIQGQRINKNWNNNLKDINQLVKFCLQISSTFQT